MLIRSALDHSPSSSSADCWSTYLPDVILTPPAPAHNRPSAPPTAAAQSQSMAAHGSTPPVPNPSSNNRRSGRCRSSWWVGLPWRSTRPAQRRSLASPSSSRLIDALEMMKQGVRRLLVRKSIAWKGFSKRFSVLYHGRWLKTVDSFSSTSSQLSVSPHPDENYCCLSREDVARFLIGCLGALAPIPLSSISALGAITPHYTHIEASTPALEAIKKIPHDPCAIAVVETYEDGTHKIIGEISSYKLWKCDYSAAAWGMGNLSAGQYVMGSEEDGGAKDDSFLDASFTSPAEDPGANIASPRSKIFSSRSIGFFNSHMAVRGLRPLRSMYRGRSAPLTCKTTNSLAAVMAQMLSHRATHVWVTEAEAEENDILVGVVSYSDILYAVTKNPGSIAPPAS